MPKATLSFNLPGESHEHLCAIKGQDMQSVFYDLMNEIRSAQKHDVFLGKKVDGSEHELIERMKSWLHEEFDARGLHELFR